MSSLASARQIAEASGTYHCVRSASQHPSRAVSQGPTSAKCIRHVHNGLLLSRRPFKHPRCLRSRTVNPVKGFKNEDKQATQRLQDTPARLRLVTCHLRQPRNHEGHPSASPRLQKHDKPPLSPAPGDETMLGLLCNTVLWKSRKVAAGAAVTAFPSSGADSAGADEEPLLDEERISEVGHGVLSAIQVQSKEEQERLAATPAHPMALYAMYATYFANCFVEHTWRFAWPALLAVMYSSLLPVAVISFVQQLFIFATGPLVGDLLDSSPRVLAFNLLNVVQSATMLISAACMAYGFQSGASQATTASALVFQPWFLILLVVSAVERVTGLASGVAFERDWVVQIAGPKRAIALSNANAVLRRVDLFCEIIGPFSFGILMTMCSPNFCITVAAISMVVFLPALVGLVSLTDSLSRGVLRRAKHVSVRAPPEPRPGQLAEDHHQEHSQVQGGMSVVWRGWKLYLGQPILPASLAYVLLSLNAVLAPSGLMTSFLTQRGMEANMIGGFRGACAAMGFFATFLSTPFIARCGLLKAGAGALIFTSVCIVLSVFVYISMPAGGQGPLFLFLGLIILSRLGNWLYDVVDAQIFQTAIPPSQASLVGTTELSLASLAELVMLGIAIVFDDVSHFGSLAKVSMMAVIAATALYCFWIRRLPSDLRSMFPEVRKEGTAEQGNTEPLPVLQPSM